MTDSTALPATDTLATAVAETAHHAADTVATDAAAMFGPGSFVPAAPTGGHAAADIRALTDGAGSEVAVLLCMTAYILLLYRYRGYFGTLARTVISDLSDDINFEEHNRVFSSFMTLSSLLGLAVAALCIMRTAELWAWLPAASGLPGYTTLLATMAAMLCILLFQRALLRISGNVALCRPLTDRVERIRKQLFALLTIAATPVALMFIYSEPPAATLFGALTAAATASAAALLLYKSLTLFRRQKVSILNWFLYLCAVEIFPVSLCILALLRSGRWE